MNDKNLGAFEFFLCLAHIFITMNTTALEMFLSFDISMNFLFLSFDISMNFSRTIAMEVTPAHNYTEKWFAKKNSNVYEPSMVGFCDTNPWAFFSFF